MARQDGYIRATGNINDVTLYIRNGVYYARMKSCLTGKIFWKHKAFEGSRNSCRRFALGNTLASQVYRNLPKEKRVYQCFCWLKTAAILYLKQSFSATEVLSLLRQQALQEADIVQLPPRKKRQPKPFPYAKVVTPSYIGLTVGRLEYLENKYGEEKFEEMVESFFHALKLPPTPIRALQRAATA